MGTVLAALAELALIAFIVYKALQLRKGYRERAATGMDLYDSLRESAGSVVGTVAGGALAYEATLLYYATAGWSRSPEIGDGAFSVHRNVAYIPLMLAVMIALVVETIAVHLLLRLWSPVAAWVLTAISLYTLVWLIGDIHAVRLRPTRIRDGILHFRLGLRWDAKISIASIQSVGTPENDDRPGGREHLKAILVGAPNLRIQLREPIRAVGFYGLLRRVRTIDLHVDDPDGFVAGLQA